MKRLVQIIAILILTCTASHTASAQEPGSVQKVVMVGDSLVTVALDTNAVAVKVDSAMLGRSIEEMMPSQSKGDAATVNLRYGPGVEEALSAHIASNSIKQPMGYRIRIYFSNAQNARNESLAAASRFSAKWEHPVYRSYINPNFKVTVGNFRTRSEAMAILEAVRRDFPAAFIVKERIYYTY